MKQNLSPSYLDEGFRTWSRTWTGELKWLGGEIAFCVEYLHESSTRFFRLWPKLGCFIRDLFRGYCKWPSICVIFEKFTWKKRKWAIFNIVLDYVQVTKNSLSSPLSPFPAPTVGFHSALPQSSWWVITTHLKNTSRQIASVSIIFPNHHLYRWQPSPFLGEDIHGILGIYFEKTQ